MRSILKFLIPFIFAVVFIIPGYTFFVINKDSTSVLFSSNPSSSEFLYTLFRLFGLYGFTFVWGQIVLGPFMLPLRGLFGSGILKVHRIEGIFALTFSILHPLIFYLAFLNTPKHGAIYTALYDYFGGSSLTIYGYLGPIALNLMIVTVVTALLANTNWFINKWRYFHFLNYVIFILVFIHSFKIGTEVALNPLKTLYLFFAITFLAAVGYRILYRRVWMKFKQENQNMVY